MDTNCNRTSVASALPLFLTGLGTGIALTLLFAPLSGEATRNLIGRKVQDGQGWVKDQAGAAQDYAATQGADLRKRANEVAEAITRA